MLNVLRMFEYFCFRLRKVEGWYLYANYIMEFMMMRWAMGDGVVCGGRVARVGAGAVSAAGGSVAQPV